MKYIPGNIALNIVAIIAAFSLTTKLVQANGMVPETSVVIVNEAEGEMTMKVTNTDPMAALLHVKVLDIPEDTAPLLLVTPSVSRVESGKVQQVRFILRTENGPLKTQRLKRATFEGIQAVKQTAGTTESQVGVGVRQNLPVIIHPRGLAKNDTPWTGLQWSLDNGKLKVSNPSAYVVRLSQEVRILPTQTTANLPKSYVLPGETLDVAMDKPINSGDVVRFNPATVYGFIVDHYDAPLKR